MKLPLIAISILIFSITSLALPSNESHIFTVLTNYYTELSNRKWEHNFLNCFWTNATMTLAFEESPPKIITIEQFVSTDPYGLRKGEVFNEEMTGFPDIVIHDPRLAQVKAAYRGEFGSSSRLNRWTGIDGFTLVKSNGQWKIFSLVSANKYDVK